MFEILIIRKYFDNIDFNDNHMTRYRETNNRLYIAIVGHGVIVPEHYNV